jgi:hypothetical protein
MERVVITMSYRHIESVFDLWFTGIWGVFLSYGLQAY